MRIITALVAGAAASALLAGAAQAQDMTVAWKGAPQFTNDDAIFKVRGRILVDAIFQDIDRGGGTAGDIKTRNFRGRQVFLGVEGQLNSKFAYKAEGGAVNGGAWAWDDVVIEYKPTDFTSLQFGNVKAFGLENLTSTRFRTFMEQGAIGEVTEATYNLGVVAKTWGQNWTLSGAIQGDSLNSADVTAGVGAAANAKERMQYVVRGTFAPILTDTTKLHLGAWARYRDSGTEAGFTYQTRPNNQVSGRYSGTGVIGESDTTYGAEAIYIFNNFSVQGEYAQIDVDPLPALAATAVQSGKITTGYVFGSWFVTGDSRIYDPAKAEINRPKIKNPVTAGGFGGVEIAARYDFADFSDVRGTTGANPTMAGDFKAYTVGVNYYPTSYVRFTANFTHSESENAVLTNSYEQDTLQFRSQIDF